MKHPQDQAEKDFELSQIVRIHRFQVLSRVLVPLLHFTQCMLIAAEGKLGDGIHVDKN